MVTHTIHITHITHKTHTGVGLACIKEGKGVDINMEAFMWASLANAAAALKGKFGSSVTKALKADPSKNMDAANVYAVMNIIAAFCTIPMVVINELPTLRQEWDTAVEEHGLQPLLMNLFLSGVCFYFYNEFAFAFTSHVGAVTSSVLNTAKRVIIIVVSSIIFQEAMERYVKLCRWICGSDGFVADRYVSCWNGLRSCVSLLEFAFLTTCSFLSRIRFIETRSWAVPLRLREPLPTRSPPKRRLLPPPKPRRHKRHSE